MKQARRLALQMTLLRARFPVGRSVKQHREPIQRGAWPWLVSIVLLIAVGLAPASPSLAAPVNIKLSDPLAVGRDVSSFGISPDSSRVVYLADQDTDGVDELYSVSLAGGSSVKLNGPLVEGGNVSDFRISPDNTRVVYRADKELYSVPLAGGSQVKLNGPEDAENFQISPDSSRVVYDSRGVHGTGLAPCTLVPRELYSVLLTGGSPVKLQWGTTAGFQISPDSSWVAYRIVVPWMGLHSTDLYSVSLAGGSPVRLSDPVDYDGYVWNFQVSSDSSRVIYQADQNTRRVYELYSVPLAGGSQVKLNGSLVDGGNVWLLFQISPDSSRVVYQADQDADEVFELYSVPLAGGSPVKLNGPLVSGGDVASDFQISPDSSRVVYQADQDTRGVDELYSVPLTGGSPVKLNDPPDMYYEGVADFQVSLDSSRVVYRVISRWITTWPRVLFSVPLAGGTPVELGGSPILGPSVSDFFISRDSSHVVYKFVGEIYSVPLAGGNSVKLNSPLVRGRDVQDFQISPDSSRVVYLADQDMDEVFELYSVPLGGGTPVKLNASLVTRIYLPLVLGNWLGTSCQQGDGHAER